MFLLAVIISIIPVIVYPEPILGAFKNEYLLKEYILFLTAIVVLAKSLFKFFKSTTIVIKNTDRLLILFLLFATISYIINRPIDYTGFALYITYAILFITVSHMPASKIRPYAFCWLWIIALGICGIYGIHQRINNEAVVAMLGNRNFYAGFIVAGFPFLLYGIMHYIKSKKYLYLIILIPLGCMCFVNLLATRSRGALLVLVIQGIFALALIFKKPLRLLGIAAGLLIITIFLPSVHQSINRHLQDDVRPYIWEGTFHMICDHPFTGTGPGNFYIEYPKYRVHDYFLSFKATDATRHAHNELLEVWAETGTLGLLALLGILAYIGYVLINKHKRSPLHPFIWCLTFSSAGIMLHNLVDVNMRYHTMSAIFWVQLGMLSAYSETGSKLKVPRLHRLVRYAIWGVFAFGCVYIVNHSIIQSMQSQICFQKGIDAKEEGDWQTAVKHYKQGIAADPSNLSLLYHLGFAFGELNMLDDAIETYSVIVQLAPYYASVRKNLGTLYVKKKDFNKALEEYKIQQMLDPYDPDLYLNMAYCYNQLGFSDKAAETHAKALDTYREKAMIFINANRPLMAIPYLETALQLNSGDDETVKLLTQAYLQSGNRKHAIELLNVFSEYFPQKVETKNFLRKLIQSDK